MNKINTILALVLILSLSTISNAQIDLNRRHIVVEGIKDSVYAKKLKEQRFFWVRLPKGVEANDQNAAKYPVLYLLDGGAHMQSISAVFNQLAPAIIPEMIVVGIGNYKDRTRDLTPTHMDLSPNGSDWTKTSGGGDEFVNFIVRDLISYIDGKYPTANYRTFVGHSFGGLLVVNTLLKRPELFQNYLAIDPSLWWDDAIMVKRLAEVLEKNPIKDKTLFMSLASIPGVQFEMAQKDMANAPSELHANLSFINTLKSTPNRLNFTWRYYENENHGTVPLISMYEGLKSIFSWYKMPQSVIDIINDPNTTVSQIRSALREHYAMLSERFGYGVLPDEGFLNESGYAFLGRSAEKSLAFFSMALEYYPASANVYDSMADYYIAQGDKASALKYVGKAFEISKSDYHKQRMKELGK